MPIKNFLFCIPTTLWPSLFLVGSVANKVAYSEKQVIRVVRNLFKQGKLTRIKKQITSGRPTYFYGHST